MEITLGLLAACLPTLRGLVKSKSADSIFRSVRNVLSLRSASSSSQSEISKGFYGSSGKSSRSLEREVITVTVGTKVSQERAAPWV